MAIKAIIFDCFGVLVENSLDTFYKTYLSDKPEQIQLIKQFDNMASAGELTYDELLDKIATITGLDRVEIKNFLDNNPPNLELFDYISSKLKPNYKIGFLSNAAANWLGELFTEEQQSLFDDFVLSFEHGINKPSPEIFKLAVARLGLRTDECILIDDVAEYCDGARSAGLQALQYKDLNQVRAELEYLISAS